MRLFLKIFFSTLVFGFTTFSLPTPTLAAYNDGVCDDTDFVNLNDVTLLEDSVYSYFKDIEIYPINDVLYVAGDVSLSPGFSTRGNDCEITDPVTQQFKLVNQDTFDEYDLGTFATDAPAALVIDSPEYPDGLYSFVVVNLDTNTEFASDIYIDNTNPTIEFDAEPFGLDTFDPFVRSQYVYLDVFDNSNTLITNFTEGRSEASIILDWGYHNPEESLTTFENILYIGFNNSNLPEFPYTGIRFSFLPEYSFFDYAGNEIDYGPYYVPETTQPYIFAASNVDLDEDGYTDAVDIEFTEDVDDNILSGSGFIFSDSNGQIKEIATITNPSLRVLRYTFITDTSLLAYEYPLSILSNHDIVDMNGNRFLKDYGSYNYLGEYNYFGFESARTLDLNSNGKIDAVKVYFEEDIDDSTINSDSFSFSNGATVYGIDNSAGCGGPDRYIGQNMLCIEISENPTDYDTGEVITMTYNPFLGTAIENYNNTLIFNYITQVDTLDEAPPVQIGVGEVYGHPDYGNYYFNSVEVIFSEPVNGTDYYLQIEGVDWENTSGNGTNTLIYTVPVAQETDGGLIAPTLPYNLLTTYYDVTKVTDLVGNALVDVPGEYPSEIGDLLLVLGYYRDLDRNGKTDSVELRFSYPVDDSTVDYTDFTVDGFTVTGVISTEDYEGDIANDETVYLSLQELETVSTYFADPVAVTLTYDDTSPIRGYDDMPPYIVYSNYTANSYSFTASDGASSYLQDVQTKDEDEDGFLDAAYFYYTEPSYDFGQDDFLNAPFTFSDGLVTTGVLNDNNGLTIYSLNNPGFLDSSFRPTTYYARCCVYGNEDGNDAIIPDEFTLSDAVGPRVIDVYTGTNDIVYVQFNEAITWEDYDLDSFDIYNNTTDNLYLPDSFTIDAESSILELQFPEGTFTSLNLADFVIEYASIPDAEVLDAYGNIANPVGSPFSITNLYKPELLSAETITTYSILVTFSDLVSNVDETDFTFTNILGNVFDIEVLETQVLITFDTAFSPNLDNGTVSIAESSDIISYNNGVLIDPLVDINSSMVIADGIDPTLIEYNAKGSEDLTTVYNGENILITFELDSDDYFCTVNSGCVNINGGAVDSITNLGNNIYEAAFDPAVLGECVNCTFNLTFSLLDETGNSYVEEILDYASGITFIDEVRESAPTLSLLDATALTATSVTLNAEIDKIGSAEITTQGFFVGGVDRGADSPSLDLGAFSLVLTGLTCNTTYNYYAYSTNIVGNTVTVTSSFLTLACPEDDNSGGSSGRSSGSPQQTPTRPAAPVVPPPTPTIPTPTQETTPAPVSTPTPIQTPTPSTDSETPETTSDSTQSDSNDSTSESNSDQSENQAPSYQEQYQELSTTLKESNPTITESEIESVAEYINLNLPFTPANTSTQKLFDLIDVYLKNSQPKTFDYSNSCSAKIISTTTDKDTDLDGCSDALEIAFGMDPTTPDMLACNISVAANYNDCSTVPVEVPSDAFLKLNFKATRFSESEFLVPGSVSLSMDLELEDDQVCLAARDKDKSRGLDYELGCYEVEYLNEIKGFNYDRKIANFALMNNKDLADGEYRVVAYAETSIGTKVFDYQDIVIDRTAPTIPLELVEFAGLSADDVSKAKLVRLDANSDQVYAVFKTNPNTVVEAYWNSILLTSNILADSTSGLTYLELPTWFDLESNETHKLTAYAYSLSDPSAISQTYSLKFKLDSKADQITKLLLLVGGITVIGGLLTLNRFRLKRSRQAKIN